MITATLSLVCQADQERSNGSERIGLCLKAGKLRMMTVALGSTSKDFLGEQRLSPCGDQSFRIKESRMHCP